ncbi:hypothetical protein [Chamaesiphon sp.]|uniref:hypothetical protein n=1 Tax=Chamaesiphon sp. TaxID=2814140 RepID=UPI0035943ED9
MKTHHRLIISIVALSVGIFLIFSGSFEPEELFSTLNIPRSAGKYMAFAGMGMTGVSSWQLLTLLQNRQRTWQDLVDWAQQERSQAIVVGVSSMAIGMIVAFALLWSVISTLQSGSRMTIRPVPIGGGIAIGCVLVWLGAMLIKVAISGNSNSH